MPLKDEVRVLVQETFGEFSAKKIDEFAQEIDPETNKKEFLDKCVDFLSTLLGKQGAQDKMMKFYEKYGCEI